MFTQSLKKGVLSAVFLLLVAPSRQSAQTTINFTPLQSSNTEGPLLFSAERPCGSSDQHFCLNDGICIYPQDSTKPSCICPSGFSGNRCHDLDVDSVFYVPHMTVEHLISVTCGAAIFVFFLVIGIYCIVLKRFKKKEKQITSATCEVTV